MNVEQVGPTLSALGAKMPFVKLNPEDQQRVAELAEELKTILDAYPKK